MCHYFLCFPIFYTETSIIDQIEDELKDIKDEVRKGINYVEDSEESERKRIESKSLTTYHDLQFYAFLKSLQLRVKIVFHKVL